jgi:flagellar protein FliO/FliZ
MFDTLFGEGQYALKMLFAFIVVFGLLALALWLVRRFGGERLSGSTTRGRQPRLAVIDRATVDGRRQLVLVRRDNVEHLLMVGGPTDVVVEPNIVRAAPVPREVARPAPATETLPRPVPLGEENMWPLQPEPAPRNEPIKPEPRPEPRPQRAPPPPAPAAEQEPQRVAPEPELPPLPPAARERRPRPDPLSGLAEELGRVPSSSEPARFEPPSRQAPRREPRPRPQAPLPAPASSPSAAAPQFQSTADQNLAEMAQRLEAALRRPNMRDEGRPPAPAPKAEPRMAEPKMVEPRSLEPRTVEPKAIEPIVEAAAEPAPTPEGSPASPAATSDSPGPARNDEKPAKPAPQKSLYDSLEQEMASLLGRPGNKS